jgi:hypothetical protein
VPPPFTPQPPLRPSRASRYIATRFTFPSTPITPAWPALPFDGLQSAFGGMFDGNSVAFALSSSDLFMWANGRWLSVTSFGASLPITPGSAASPAFFNGTDGVMLAVPVGLYFVVCDWSSEAPSKCSGNYILALPFGSVRSVAASGTTILVAPLRGGLFALDLSSDTCALPSLSSPSFLAPFLSPLPPSAALSCPRDAFHSSYAAHFIFTLPQSLCRAGLQSLRWHHGR